MSLSIIDNLSLVLRLHLVKMLNNNVPTNTNIAGKSAKVHLKENSEENFQLGKSGGGSSWASRSVRKSSDCSPFTSPSTPVAPPDAAGIPPDMIVEDVAAVDEAAPFELLLAWAINTSFRNFISCPSAVILSSSSLLSLFNASTFSFVSLAF